MKLRGTKVEELEDVLEDLELLGLFKFERDGVLISREFVYLIIEEMVPYLINAISRAGLERVREEVAEMDTDDIIVMIAVAALSAKIVEERIKRGMSGRGASILSKEYFEKLTKAVDGIIKTLKETHPEAYIELVMMLNVALQATGINISKLPQPPKGRP